MKTVNTYSIDSADIIRSVSVGFIAFANENMATEITKDMFIGKSIYSFLAGEKTKHLYELLLNQARKKTEEVTIPFRCDSPSIRRYMELRIKSAPDNEVEFEATLVREEKRDPVELLDYTVNRSEELLRICSWCKSVLANGQWVEAEIAIELLDLFNDALLPQITHGICEQCKVKVMGKLKQNS